jgi:hypothetical protein
MMCVSHTHSCGRAFAMLVLVSSSFSGPLALSLALCSLSFHPLFVAVVAEGDITGGYTDGVGSNALFYFPYGVSVSSDGSYALVADAYNHLIRRIVISTASVSTLAGLPWPYGSTDGVGSNARFNEPQGVSFSSDGSYALVADSMNCLIRKIVISTASVSTLAGLSFGSTNGVGSNARFHFPIGVSVSSNDVYALVADTTKSLIRMIVLSTASVSTLAGVASSDGSTDGVGSNALFNLPAGVSISSDGSYALVSELFNYLIRKIIISTATVSTLAGLALSSGSTDGVGSNARFYYPHGVSVSSDGSYALVADTVNYLIRMIIISTANVSTLTVLTSSSGSTNGVGSNARFYYPNAVSISSDGSYALVPDTINHLIRKIVISTANVSILVGLSGSYSPTSAPTSSPTTAPTSSSKYSFGVVFGDPESQGLRVGSAVLLDYFTSFGAEGLNSFYL